MTRHAYLPLNWTLAVFVLAVATATLTFIPEVPGVVVIAAIIVVGLLLAVVLLSCALLAIDRKDVLALPVVHQLSDTSVVRIDDMLNKLRKALAEHAPLDKLEKLEKIVLYYNTDFNRGEQKNWVENLEDAIRQEFTDLTLESADISHEKGLPKRTFVRVYESDDPEMLRDEQGITLKLDSGQCVFLPCNKWVVFGPSRIADQRINEMGFHLAVRASMQGSNRAVLAFQSDRRLDQAPFYLLPDKNQRMPGMLTPAGLRQWRPFEHVSVLTKRTNRVLGKRGSIFWSEKQLSVQLDDPQFIAQAEVPGLSLRIFLGPPQEEATASKPIPPKEAVFPDELIQAIPDTMIALSTFAVRHGRFESLIQQYKGIGKQVPLFECGKRSRYLVRRYAELGKETRADMAFKFTRGQVGLELSYDTLPTALDCLPLSEGKPDSIIGSVKGFCDIALTGDEGAPFFLHAQLTHTDNDYCTAYLRLDDLENRFSVTVGGKRLRGDGDYRVPRDQSVPVDITRKDREGGVSLALHALAATETCRNLSDSGLWDPRLSVLGRSIQLDDGLDSYTVRAEVEQGIAQARKGQLRALEHLGDGLFAVGREHCGLLFLDLYSAGGECRVSVQHAGRGHYTLTIPKGKFSWSGEQGTALESGLPKGTVRWRSVLLHVFGPHHRPGRDHLLRLEKEWAQIRKAREKGTEGAGHDFPEGFSPVWADQVIHARDGNIYRVRGVTVDLGIAHDRWLVVNLTRGPITVGDSNGTQNVPPGACSLPALSLAGISQGEDGASQVSLAQKLPHEMEVADEFYALGWVQANLAEIAGDGEKWYQAPPNFSPEEAKLLERKPGHPIRSRFEKWCDLGALCQKTEVASETFTNTLLKAKRNYVAKSLVLKRSDGQAGNLQFMARAGQPDNGHRMKHVIGYCRNNSLYEIRTLQPGDASEETEPTKRMPLFVSGLVLGIRNNDGY